jgi:putative monooxygenase
MNRPKRGPARGGLMPIVRSEDHPVLIRGPGLPTLQHLVGRASGSDAVTVLRNVFASGQAVPEHTHEIEEVLLVTTGHCVITVAGRPEVARTGDAVIIAPGTRHAIHHNGDEPCEVIAVLASPDAQIARPE